MSGTSISPRAAAERALQVVARVRSGTRIAQRSLPVRSTAEDIRRSWADPGDRAAVLDGIEAVDASLELGREKTAWGTTATVRLVLDKPLPRMAAQVLAGRAVRRLKALAETGEVPTAERNPSARSDAGEAAS